MRSILTGGVARAANILAQICAIFLFFPPLVAHGAEETGWEPTFFIDPPGWHEQASRLPAPPDQDRLQEVAGSTGSFPYRVYIDPQSLTIGDDRVVRYTVVAISPSGARNITYEGLHCGEQAYRRYAYLADGQWQETRDSPWQSLRGSRTDHYRYVFYHHYMCDPGKPGLKADEILGNISASWGDLSDAE